MDNYVVGIGACNVDFYVKSLVEAKSNYDHPSIINTSCGGVTRNILDTLGILGVKSYLLTCVGDDNLKDYIFEKSNSNIDFSKVKIVKDTETSKFIQMLDKNNDMLFAGCDMSILNNLDIDYIKENDSLIRNAKVILIDPSLKIDVLKYIFETYKDLKIFLDPISDNYAEAIKPYINSVYEIKPNIKELEVLVDSKINNEEETVNACKKLIEQGVTRVIVSMGKNGSIFCSKENNFKVKLKEVENIKNASGAGDGFMSLLIYSYLNNIDDYHSLELASAAGILAVQSDSTNQKDLSVKILEEIIKERKI